MNSISAKETWDLEPGGVIRCQEDNRTRQVQSTFNMNAHARASAAALVFAYRLGKKNTFHGKLFSLLVIASLSLSTASFAVTIEDYKAHCGTYEGRQLLLEKLPPGDRHDLEMQAIGSGAAVDQHMEQHIEQLCAFIVPGSVQSQTDLQTWSFRFDPFAPAKDQEILGLRLVENPPRCGPRCEGSFVVAPDADVKKWWQACRVRYVSNYHSAGYTRFTTNPTASLEVIADQWIDSYRFHAFQFKLIAHDRSYIDIRDVEFDLVPLDMSEERRKELGCVVAKGHYIERVGQVECQEDRSGFRNSDDCSIIHRAVGARRHIQHPAMRKLIISKPAGDTGEEKVVRKIGMGAGEEFIVRPGQTVVLLSPPRYTDDRPASVEIVTRKVGADGMSKYKLSSEWNKL